MEKQLDPCNCLGMKAFAESHGLEKLAADAEKMILQKFMELVEYEEFLTMPKGKRSKNKKGVLLEKHSVVAPKFFPC